MLKRFVIVVIVLLVALAASAATRGERAPLGLYQWRGYAEICLTSDVIGSGCSLAQTKDVYDTQEQCQEAVPALLETASARYATRDPDMHLSANWLCGEDRSVFNT